MRYKWVDGDKLRWCWLVLDDVALMLQEFWTGGVDRNATGEKLGVGMSIYFPCEDALELYRTFRAQGVDMPRPSAGNRMWVTHVTDPDGYHLFFESLPDAPEESVYSD
jgi:hypothetical protein